MRVLKKYKIICLTLILFAALPGYLQAQEAAPVKLASGKLKLTFNKGTSGWRCSIQHGILAAGAGHIEPLFVFKY